MTIDEAMALKSPATKFHCTEEDNTFKIRFGDFRLRELESGVTLVEISAEEREAGEELWETEEDRIIKYQLGPDFLDLRTIGMQVEFLIGEEPVPSLRLIENHYFKDELVKSYDFEFGFWIPGSKNTWETIYDLPELDDEQKFDIISNPYETKSDSFFFVEDKLVIHQRWEYSYEA